MKKSEKVRMVSVLVRQRGVPDRNEDIWDNIEKGTKMVGLNKPIFLKDVEDCQGNLSSYWRCTGWLSDGKCVTGYGLTPTEAEQAAKVRLDEREAFLASSPEAKLREIVAKDHLLSSDMETAIKAIARLLLN